MTTPFRHAPIRPKAPAQQGVGLIEVLIAILIFSFGILGLVGLQARATQYSVSAEDMNRAALLANEASSMMWNTGTVSLSASAVAAWQAKVASAADGGIPAASAVITVSGNVAEISITWKPVSAAASAASSNYTTQVAF